MSTSANAMMQKLKLDIIQSVLACQDESVLQTVKQLLSTLPTATLTANQGVNPLHQALLGEPQSADFPSASPSSKEATAMEQDIQELQQMIKDIFG